MRRNVSVVTWGRCIMGYKGLGCMILKGLRQSLALQTLGLGVRERFRVRI